MGPTWVMSPPDGPHVGPMNLAIRGAYGMLLPLSINIQNGSQALNTYGGISRGLGKCLLCIFSRNVSITNALDYLLYILCNILVCLCSTGPSKLWWPRGYICNSYCHHQIENINFPIDCVSVFLCLRWLYPQILPFASYICRIRESWAFVSITAELSVVCSNNWVLEGLKVIIVCLRITLSHYHNLCTYLKASNIHKSCRHSLCIRLSLFSSLSLWNTRKYFILAFLTDAILALFLKWDHSIY